MMRSLVTCLAVLAVTSVHAGAQGTLRYDWDSPEGRLMGYYSAALAFTPVAAPMRPAGLTLGIELAYIPPLSEAQRSAGFSKEESTNLVPVLPRPRIAFALPWSLTAEASYIPPVKVFGVRASILSAAVTRPVWHRRQYTVSARLSASSSLIRAAITCNDDIRDGGELFYTFICHDQESEDHFHAPAVGLELLAVRSTPSAWVPWAGVGVRHERDKFIVGVRNPDGSVDPNHPILLTRITRPYLMGGVTWRRLAVADLSAEMFYAPGSVLTGRIMGSTTWRRMPWSRR